MAATLMAWLLLFPSGRVVTLRLVGRWRARAQRLFAGVGRRSATLAGQSTHAVKGAVARTAGDVARQRWTLLGAFALIAVPSLLVLALLRGPITLDGFVSSGDQTDDLISELLRGELLVPPPPLPPEMFMTAEVERIRPLLGGADRRWEQFDADFRQRLLVVYKVMLEQHGYEMVLLEGYRSPERQDMLSRRGGHVTNARAWQSWHQYGLAADSAFRRGGRVVIDEKDPWAMRGYRLYGETAEAAGLTWGGRWRSIQDYGHVELRRPEVRLGRRRQNG